MDRQSRPRRVPVRQRLLPERLVEPALTAVYKGPGAPPTARALLPVIKPGAHAGDADPAHRPA
jgi:hypothetical protein